MGIFVTWVFRKLRTNNVPEEEWTRLSWLDTTTHCFNTALPTHHHHLHFLFLLYSNLPFSFVDSAMASNKDDSDLYGDLYGDEELIVPLDDENSPEIGRAHV